MSVPREVPLSEVLRMLDRCLPGHRREEKLHHQLAEAATDPDRLQKLDAELRQVVAEKEAAEEQWMELAEELG